MSHSKKRFFKNPFQDYNNLETSLNIDNNYWSNYLEEIALYCVKKTKLNNETCDGGLYVGNLGLVYMINKLLSNGFCKKYENELIKYLHDSIEINESNVKKEKDKTMMASFILGNCGFYTMASLVRKYFENDNDKCLRYSFKFCEAVRVAEKKYFLPNGGDELFVGRAGIFCGVLFYKHNLGIDVLNDNDLFKILDVTIESGREYAKKYNSPCPLLYSYYNTEYIGAAHGLSSILQMILCFPNYLNQRPDVVNDLKRCVDFLISIQTQDGNFPSAIDDLALPKRSLDNELIHWCHGAPGVVWLMAKAFLIWKEEKYLKSCKLCDELVWNFGLLRKGPGICHGIAGNGYVHLLLYRLTNEDKYLYRALKFAEFLENEEFKTNARRPDNPFSLYEGLAGTVCFLIDLLNPKQAQFPFFDIFF